MVTSRVRATSAVLVVAAIWATVFAMYAATRQPVVAVAGTIDLTVTAGLAMYLIAVRGKHLPRRALWLVIALGAIAARWVLVHDATRIALALAGTLEVVALAVVAIRIRRARRGWRAARAGGADRVDALVAALGAIGMPVRVAYAAASEFVVMAYAITGWRTPRIDRVFTVHRTNGWALYAGVFAIMTVVETPLVHVVLVAYGHPTAAWTLSILSVYSVLWLVGDVHALRHGGVIVRDDALDLHLGIRWRGRIPLADIERVERGTASDKRTDFSILGANVVVTLARPCTLHGLVGRRRTTSVLALSIDEPDRLIATWESLRAAPAAPRRSPGSRAPA